MSRKFDIFSYNEPSNQQTRQFEDSASFGFSLTKPAAKSLQGRNENKNKSTNSEPSYR